MTEYDEEFRIEDLGIMIYCPACGIELVNDPDSLPLAESPTGVMFECGQCELITGWKISGNPPVAERYQ
jgi:hypothetical protein